MSARVLIAEDEPLVAVDLEECLIEAGFEVLEIAGSVDSALRAVRAREFDVAVLDGNLRGQSIEAVATLLSERRVPFLFVTGYGRDALPAAFSAAPFIAKPFDRAMLVKAVNGLLNRPLS
jgi:DNA-binding response OmpR family regulator